MRILITGVGGFVGNHLTNHLFTAAPDAEIHATVLGVSGRLLPPQIRTHMVDLRDARHSRQVIAEVQPDYIYHLAAQASVPASFENPWATLENNIRAQLNLILACIDEKPDARLLVVSSGEIYGAAAPEDLPTHERAVLRPSSPYSVSKVTQDMLAEQYHFSHHLPIMRARPFNHIGPGQSQGFVAPDFAMQIAQIEVGVQDPVIYVGDLSTKRDFTDVRDIVRAYRFIMEQGEPGQVYNVASGKTRSIRSLLDTLLSYSKVNIEVKTDPTRMRPSRIPVLWGDCSRLHRATGWQPIIPFEQTLLDVLNDCRQRIQVST